MRWLFFVTMILMGCTGQFSIDRTEQEGEESTTSGASDGSSSSELSHKAVTGNVPVSGSGTSNDPYVLELLAGHDDVDITIEYNGGDDSGASCTPERDWITVTYANSELTLNVAPTSSDLETVTVTCTIGAGDSAISIVYQFTNGSAKLAYNGASAATTAPQTRTFHQNVTGTAWTLTGECNSSLGDVSIAAGRILDNALSGSCTNNAFSIPLAVADTKTTWYGRIELVATQSSGSTSASATTYLYKHSESAATVVVSTAAELAAGLTGAFSPYLLVINADIDLADISATDNWTPVDNFAGTIEGQGYTIDNLHIGSGTTKALVDASYGSGFYNLTVNGTINGSSNLAVMAVDCADCEFEDVTVSANITGSGNYCGAITAIGLNTIYRRVSSTGSINCTGITGGIVGRFRWGSAMYNSNSGATVTETSVGDVGGLIGWSYSGGGYTPLVEDCYFDGPSVTGTSEVGGLIGSVDSSGPTIVRRSYANTTVTASGVNTGGLVGRSDNVLTIEDSYFAGTVSGTTIAGGLVGDGTATITDSYSVANNTSSGGSDIGLLVGDNTSVTVNTSYYLSTATCGNCDHTDGTGKTDAELKQQATFSGWDFDTVWQISSGSYPTFQ